MTDPPEPSQPGTHADSAVLHQVVHGYDEGHRMLASSRTLPDHDMRLIDRLSDASGERPNPVNDGYLTGYPLSSGFYALACTWYAPEAPRPNVVWTHTLLIPPSVLAWPTVAGLAYYLCRPTSKSDLSGYTVPIRVASTSHALSAASTDYGPDLASLVSRLYRPLPGDVWFTADPVERRNALCLAVWDQQWPRLRAAFAFCSGALEGRRLADRPFDLLCAPNSHRVPPQPHDAPAIRTDVVGALTSDLIQPGRLRDFLWLVGPDSSRRRVMALLVETYLDADPASNDPGVALGHLARRAPRPTSMRRLKRALLQPETGLLHAAPATSVLAAVLGPGVAHHVLAEDANLGGWAARVWREEPSALLASLPKRQVGATEVTVARPTVADLAEEALSELVLRQARAEHLDVIAAAHPDLAISLLRDHDHDRSWWTAWADLPDSAFAMLLRRGMLSEPTPAAVRHAVAALLGSAEGVTRWRATRDELGAPAVAELLRQIDPSARIPAWVEAVSERPDLLQEALRTLRGPKVLAVAADAVRDADLARTIGSDTWAPLASQRGLWSGSPHRAAVLFAAALAAHGEAGDGALAATYQFLYDMFAGGGNDDAWDLLAPIVPAKHDDWDRCRRLAQAVARAVHGKPGPDRPRVVELLHEGQARTTVVEELAPKHNDHGSGESATSGTKPTSSGNPIESFIRMIRPW